MFDEGGVGGEAFPTFLACIGSLPGVDPEVRHQVGALVKTLPTLGALVGLFPRVDPLMDKQVRVTAKAFPTLTARAGSLSRGDPLGTGFLAALQASPTISGFIHFRHRRVSRRPLTLIGFSLPKTAANVSFGSYR